jgi:hypothetical protein
MTLLKIVLPNNMDETREMIEQLEMEARKENEEETIETGINYVLDLELK